MNTVVVEFEEQTIQTDERVESAHVQTLKSSLEAEQVAVRIEGVPENPEHAIVAWHAAWYGIKVIATFIVHHDAIWKAVTTFVADVMDGHLHDGWVKVVVAEDGTWTTTTHKGNEYPEGSVVTVKGDQVDVRSPEPGTEFTREHFLAALREVVRAFLV